MKMAMPRVIEASAIASAVRIADACGSVPKSRARGSWATSTAIKAARAERFRLCCRNSSFRIAFASGERGSQDLPRSVARRAAARKTIAMG